MTKKTTRILSLILALLFCLPLLSAGSFASGDPDSAAGLTDDPIVASPAEDEGSASVESGENDEAVSVPEDEAAPAGAEPVLSDPDGNDEIAIIEVPEEIIFSSSSEGPDNDALFAAYVETRFYGAPVSDDLPALDGLTTGEKLTGLDKQLYDVLRRFVIKVAAGEITSTKYIIPLEEIFGSVYTVGDIESVYNAISGGRIIQCLLADLPYELYWYDKTVGYQYGYSYSYPEGKLHGEVTVSFACMSGYAAPAEPGSYNPYVTAGVDVSAAVTRAKSIVAKYADETDYDKLIGYRREICSLVSYNSAAARTSGWFGDPWQLIYVFDGDSSTNVVCEGYAKAFKYLCDLTTFKSPSIECYLVSGTMTGGTGAGAHMWNIVHMNDGKNYLVDVTNCDSGTVGAPDYLFLKGYGSGSYSSSYTFKCGSTGSISYTYDDQTADLFTTEELTLSNTDYDPSNAVPDTVKGDVNGDGKANGLDAALILKSLVGSYSLSGYSAADAAAILKG